MNCLLYIVIALLVGLFAGWFAAALCASAKMGDKDKEIMMLRKKEDK